ncbi:hypothetical protein SAMN02745673_02992 [Marinactinospora thermotolerans DSM 45154]|uniref:Uncharacterized protein n=1 Tax=Marinactinospora thermotolerans DSM 45154 TaxID=1122192 RepID=A0A1T4RU79_9ACTN|nr:hypothetical protein SAMN02745673_02992 [Marinactinospora thermotolerans DSM 45154]
MALPGLLAAARRAPAVPFGSGLSGQSLGDEEGPLL